MLQGEPFAAPTRNPSHQKRLDCRTVTRFHARSDLGAFLWAWPIDGGVDKEKGLVAIDLWKLWESRRRENRHAYLH